MFSAKYRVTAFISWISSNFVVLKTVPPGKYGVNIEPVLELDNAGTL